MQTALQLRWHNVDPSDAVAAHVREEVERLERFWDRITGCAVTLEAPSRHHLQSGAQYRVRIEIYVPRGRLMVARDPPKRHSRREFGPRELTASEVGALLWAGQGITSEEGGRAAPSAGALHPVTLTAIDARGVWRYIPEDHALPPPKRVTAGHSSPRPRSARSTSPRRRSPSQ